MKSRLSIFAGILLSNTLILLALITPVFAETITIAGTGDSQRLLRQLAQKFQQQNPGVQILVPDSVGSGGGIKLLLAGRSELARVARPLKPKEQADGIHYRLFASSPIVFVANLPEPCLTDLSEQQITDIFSGKLADWKLLGSCQPHKIYIANRESGDSSRMVLEEVMAALKAVKEPAGKTIYSTPEVYDTLTRYPHSFGYLPKAQVQVGSLTEFKFAGVSATAENVQQGAYSLAVPLGIAWLGEPTGATKLFLEYLFSREAQQLMLKMGAVPAKIQ